MKYYSFINEFSNLQKEKLQILLSRKVDSNIIEIYNLADEMTIESFAIEENLKVMISSNLGEIEKNLIKYISNYKKLIYRSSEVCLIEILSGNNSIIKVLDDVFSKLDTYLIDNLMIYYYENLNKINTSKRLYIHRNTLNYRIKKAEDITNYNFDDINNLKLLHIYYLVQNAQDNNMNL